MLTIDKTTRLFIASIKLALPEAKVISQRSRTTHGRSNYVYISLPTRPFVPYKVRISDHAIGMPRWLSCRENLLLHYRDKPDRWAVWIGEIVATHRQKERVSA